MLGGGLGAAVVGLHAQQAEALQAVPQQRDGDGEGAEEADGHRREHRRDRRELRVLGRQRRRRRRIGGGALGDAELELLALGAGEAPTSSTVAVILSAPERWYLVALQAVFSLPRA